MCPWLVSGSFPDKTFINPTLTPLIIHRHSQLDWLWNLLGERPLSVSVRIFPEEISTEISILIQRDLPFLMWVD